MRSTRILMTGGTGFLGRYLLRRLIRDGCTIVLLKRPSSRLAVIEAELPKLAAVCDVTTDPIQTVLERHPCDLILHCATNYGRGNVEPTEIIEANLTLPLQLIQHGRRVGVTAFINTDTILDKQINYYSLSKRQFADWHSFFSSDMACVNVALEHFYGPGDDPSKFVTWVIRELLRRVPRLELTPGEQKRDFVYIDDVVEAFSRVIPFAGAAKPGIYRFEVGTGESVTIRRFVEACKRIAGNEETLLRFGAIPYRSNEVMISRADVSALHNLGWAPAVGFEDGLARTIGEERAGSTS